jgi:hypothetical protein
MCATLFQRNKFTMKTRSVGLALFLALVALPLSTHAAPPLNAPCEVELRRDATGPGSSSGTRVGFTGKLKSMDKDWICLDADKQGEVWIPLSAIQWIRIGEPKD